MVRVFTANKVLSPKGSEKGISRRWPERPLGEHDPLGVRPNVGVFSLSFPEIFWFVVWVQQRQKTLGNIDQETRRGPEIHGK